MKNKKTTEISNFFEYVQQLGGTTDREGKLNIPANMGKGYLKRIRLSPQLSIVLQQFEVNKPIKIRRKEKPGNKNTLIFSFRNVLNNKPGNQLKSPVGSWPSVQVSTFDVGIDINLPANLLINNLIIGIDISLLKEMLTEKGTNKLIVQMINGQQPYLYEEIISTKIQTIARDIFQEDPRGVLANYLYRIRAEELVYCFLTELLKRETISSYPLNNEDLRRIYAIRNKMISDLETPPQLDTLAKSANMSVSKMGRIFRQIFGDSIYNYYQKVRMQYAATLLRDKGYSVSEVGYQLGFSNLSHFTRLFERFIGAKPKKYSKGG